MRGSSASTPYDFFGHHETATTYGGNRLYAAGAATGARTFGNIVIPPADKIYAMPISCPAPITVTRVGFEMTTAAAAGKKARMGIYAATSRTELYPGALVVDCGEIAADGALGYKDFVLGTPQGLEANSLYWLCWVQDGTARMRGMSNTQAYPVLGWSSTEPAEYGAWGWRATLVYAALPATFPVAGAEVLGRAALAECPLFFYGLY